MIKNRPTRTVNKPQKYRSSPPKNKATMGGKKRTRSTKNKSQSPPGSPSLISGFRPPLQPNIELAQELLDSERLAYNVLAEKEILIGQTQENSLGTLRLSLTPDPDEDDGWNSDTTTQDMQDAQRDNVNESPIPTYSQDLFQESQFSQHADMMKAFKSLEQQVVSLTVIIHEMNKRMHQIQQTPVQPKHTSPQTKSPSIPHPNEEIITPSQTKPSQSLTDPAKTFAKAATELPFILFRGKGDVLSNLRPTRVFVFGNWNGSSEHAYQGKKADYHNNKKALEQINKTPHHKTHDVKQIGDTIETLPAWEDDKENIMLQVLRAKAECCPEYFNFLKSSGNKSLHENTNHPYWGCQKDGKDRLGFLHMQVRTMINNGTITLSEKAETTKSPYKASTPRHRQPHVISHQPQQRAGHQHQAHPHGVPQHQQQNFRSNTPPPVQWHAHHTSQPPVPVTILGDSNTKFLDTTKMTKTCNLQKVDAKNTHAAINAINNQQVRGRIVVVHTGTNNLRDDGPTTTAQNLIAIIDQLLHQQRKVVISKLLPREEADLNNAVNITNNILEQHYNNTRQVIFTNTDRFYHYNQPNRYLYTTEHIGNRRLPQLHVNTTGLVELSRQMQWCIRHHIAH